MIRSSHTRIAVWSAVISGIVLFFFIAGTTIGMYSDFVDILDAEIKETGKWFLSTIEDNEDDEIDLENPGGQTCGHYQTIAEFLDKTL